MTPQHCQALGWGAGPHGSESVPQQPPARAAFTPSHSQWHQTLLATSSFVLLALPAPHSWFPALCSLQLQFESLLTLSPLSDLTAVTSRVCPEPSSLEELRPSFPAAANVSVGWGPESVSRADILSEPQAPGLFHLDQHKHLKLSKSRTEPAPPPRPWSPSPPLPSSPTQGLRPDTREPFTAPASAVPSASPHPQIPPPKHISTTAKLHHLSWEGGNTHPLP